VTEASLLAYITALVTQSVDLDDPQLTSNFTNCHTNTPSLNLLTFAITRGWVGPVHLLLRHGANRHQPLTGLVDLAIANQDKHIMETLTHHETLRARREARRETSRSTRLSQAPTMAARSSSEDNGDEFFSHSTIDLSNSTTTIHDDYMQWGVETRIENLIYLLDKLKKQEHGLQVSVLLSKR